jgi:hypothetical protein
MNKNREREKCEFVSCMGYYMQSGGGDMYKRQKNPLQQPPFCIVLQVIVIIIIVPNLGTNAYYYMRKNCFIYKRGV